MAIFPVFDPFFWSKLAFLSIYNDSDQKIKDLPHQNYIYLENTQKTSFYVQSKHRFMGDKVGPKDLNLTHLKNIQTKPRKRQKAPNL